MLRNRLSHFEPVSFGRDCRRDEEKRCGARLRSRGVLIDPRGIKRENSLRLESKIPWLKGSDEIGARVLAYSKNDRRLYDKYKEALLTDYWNLRRHNSFVVPGSEDVGYEAIEDWAIARYLETQDFEALETDAPAPVLGKLAP